MPKSLRLPPCEFHTGETSRTGVSFARFPRFSSRSGGTSSTGQRASRQTFAHDDDGLVKHGHPRGFVLLRETSMCRVQRGKTQTRKQLRNPRGGAEVCQQCHRTCRDANTSTPRHNSTFCREGAGIQRRYGVRRGGGKTRGNTETCEHPRCTVGWVELSREAIAANRAALGVGALRQLCC